MRSPLVTWARKAAASAVLWWTMCAYGETPARAEPLGETEVSQAPPPEGRPSVFQSVIFDNLFGVSTSVSGMHLAAPLSMGMGRGDVSHVRVAADVQVHIHEALTIGVKGNASTEQVLLNGYTGERVAYNSYYLLFRAGYLARLTDRLSFWPNLGVGPAFDYTPAFIDVRVGLLVEGELPLVFSLSKNLFLAAAPGVQGRTGKAISGMGFGLNARLGLTF